ncbi:MAG TPA: PAS domain-containing protein [Ignavibacteria bacterium]|nr:PAS domain-containing protein [Ignavibacteria bacterium]
MIHKYSRYILDSLAEGVYVVDKEFKILFINKAAEQLLGKPRKGFIGAVCTTFCRSEICDYACPISKILLTGQNVIDLETVYTTPKGESIPVKINASLLLDDDLTPIGGIVSFRDDRANKSLEKLIKSDSHFHGIIGKSPVMKEIFKTIEEISDSDASVLITGETGVGKELIANAIQETSQRVDKPFVKINCAVLPENLLASELFGHVKGAFTDAVKDRKGRFEVADGGTIFLDEIGEMPLNMQIQLLRILQEGTFERIGESTTYKVNVRVIAATNKNLEEAIKQKKFREDLFYRLNVIPITVPPLRERESDILLLTEFFIEKYSHKYKKSMKEIDPDALEVILNYDWPGNVRELENAVEYSFIRAKTTDSLCLCCLPPHIRPVKKCSEKLNSRQIEIDERAEELLTLLRKNHWNKSKVAKILGVDRSTVYRRLKSINSK